MSAVYTAENVGFRCVEPAVTDSTRSAASDAVKRPAARSPTRHRLNETWGYKIKRAFSAIIASADTAVRNEEL